MRDWAINLLAVLGAAVVVGGLGLIYLPAGIVAAGVALILLALALRGMDESTRRTHR